MRESYNNKYFYFGELYHLLIFHGFDVIECLSDIVDNISVKWDDYDKILNILDEYGFAIVLDILDNNEVEYGEELMINHLRDSTKQVDVKFTKKVMYKNKNKLYSFLYCF